MSDQKEPVEGVGKPPRRVKGKPRNHRELGRAILAEVDPVTVGRELLEGGSESVKARTLETVANWAFGSDDEGGSRDSGRALHVVWNVPRPAREAPAWARLAESLPDKPDKPEKPGGEKS